MSWRPKEGWNNPHLKELEIRKRKVSAEMEASATKGKPVSGLAIGYLLNREALLRLVDAYEAGANAIIEALKNEGEYISGRVKLIPDYGQKIKDIGERGWLVFIPDEEE
ncbi:hypothetical protein LCGC14_1427600 [marine sediment metagenome]|uniref:Uncharacterized protein n=1 Tax=marine sediment metagenome TaxID=412755 RepID=A0A0F9JPU5_9ZZZZ